MGDKDLDVFLKKVNDVDSLIQNLNADDDEQRAEAVKKADQYLESYGEVKGDNRTVINKYGCNEENKRDNEMTPDAFKAAVERDAKERSELRKENLKTSTLYKEKGNKAFKETDYLTAVDWYTKAISLSPDQVTYYSNRAQVYIKLEKYENAITDCETGMKLEKTFAKLYVHKARAQMFLNNFEEAFETFNYLTKIDKKHKALVSEYLEEVKKKKVEWNKQQEANSLFEGGDTSIVKMKEIINTLRKGCTENIIEQLQLLKSLVNRESDRTAFRQLKGFNVFKENNKLLKMESSADSELKMKIIELLSAIVVEDEENSIIVSEMEGPLRVAVLLLEKNGSAEERFESTQLIYRLSQYEKARTSLIKILPMEKLTDLLLSMIGNGGDVSLVAIGIINNMALNKKFVDDHEEKLSTDFIPGIVKMMDLLCIPVEDERISKKFLPVMNTSISTISNLFHSPNIRSRFKEHQIWKSSFNLIAKYIDNDGALNKLKVLESTLGMLMNLSVESATLNKEDQKYWIELSQKLLSCKHELVQQRCIGIWDHIIKIDETLLMNALEENIPDQFITILKGKNETSKKSLMKCFALFTSSDQNVCSALYKRKALNPLLEILSASKEENVIGNTALIFSHLTKQRDIMADLIDKDIIKRLLVHATNDELSKIVRHNCTVAIGKYAVADQRYLQQLRDLHGMEILHEVMKENRLN